MRPRVRPGAAMADKAYSSAANRAYLRRRGIKAVIPVKDDQKENRRKRGRKGGRPPVFDAARYQERNAVERCFSKLRQFRAVATRYDNRAGSIRAPWMSPRSGSGSVTRFHDGTRSSVRLPRQPLAGCREPVRLRLPAVALRRELRQLAVHHGSACHCLPGQILPPVLECLPGLARQLGPQPAQGADVPVQPPPALGQPRNAAPQLRQQAALPLARRPRVARLRGQAGPCFTEPVPRLSGVRCSLTGLLSHAGSLDRDLKPRTRPGEPRLFGPQPFLLRARGHLRHTSLQSG